MLKRPIIEADHFSPMSKPVHFVFDSIPPISKASPFVVGEQCTMSNPRIFVVILKGKSHYQFPRNPYQ